MAEFLTAELVQHDEKDRTVWVSDPKSVIQAFQVNKQHGKSKTESTRQLNWIDSFQWALLRYLRRPPLRPKGPDSGLVHSDIRPFPISALDRFVLHRCEVSQATKYRRAVTALLASDYVAFGVPEVFDAVDKVVRMGLCYLFAATAADWLRVLGLNGFPSGYPSLLGLCSLVHLWWLLKTLF